MSLNDCKITRFDECLYTFRTQQYYELRIRFTKSLSRRRVRALHLGSTSRSSDRVKSTAGIRNISETKNARGLVYFSPRLMYGQSQIDFWFQTFRKINIEILTTKCLVVLINISNNTLYFYIGRTTNESTMTRNRQLDARRPHPAHEPFLSDLSNFLN